MKLFGSTNILINKTKSDENISRFEVIEAVLVRCNIADNQHQQESEALYTFTSNKSYAYLLNVEPSNLVFLKSYDTDFGEVIIIFTDQNGRPLDIENKFNLRLLINK